MGYRSGSFFVLFLGQFFFVFHSTYLNMKWQTFRPWVQEKSVQRPHMSPYLKMRWEWFWVQILQVSPLINGNAINLVSKCMYICAQILIFESFMKIGHCVFLKIYILSQKLSARMLFKIFHKIFFFRYFKLYRCEDKPKLDLKKFVISSLSTMLIRTIHLDATIELYIRKVCWPKCLIISIAGTFKWVLRSNYLW